MYKNAVFSGTFLKDRDATDSFVELFVVGERPNVLTVLKRMCDTVDVQQANFESLKMAVAGPNMSYDWRLHRSNDCALLMVFGRYYSAQ